MNEIGALLYADSRTVVNAIRDIRRSRGRIVIWVLAAVLFVSWMALRAHNPMRRVANVGATAQADLFACVAIGAFGFFLARGSRFVGLFANATEARWIVSLPVSPFAAALYVQVRALITGGARFVLALAIFSAFYLPSGLSNAEVLRDTFFELLALLATGAVLLPRRLAHGPAAAACTVAGYACIALAAIPLLRDAAFAFHVPWLGAARSLPAWHPGTVLIEPLGAHSVLVGAAMLAIAAAALAALGLAARNALPELYALSIERLERSGGGKRLPFARFGAGREPRVRVHRPSVANASRVPGGVAVFVWKAWTEYRRRATTRGTVLEAAGLILAGYVAGRLLGSTHPAVWVSIAVVVGQLEITFLSMTAGISVAAELRRPVFWLSDASLAERLAGLLAGRVWRAAAWFGLFALGLASGHARLAPKLFALVTGPALLVLCVAIGFAAFAAFPNDVDQRGPLTVLRMYVSYLVVLPPVAAGVAAGYVLHSVPLGLSIIAAGALAEAALLVAFAARRLDTSIRA